MSLNVTKEVALLKQMTVGQLRERYLQVTGETTQAGNRKWLVRRIIWRMQSIEEGGLSERAIARARELASGADLRTTAPKQRSLPADADRRTRVLACGQLGTVNLPLPGTFITRMYKGRQLQVRVVTGGFEYEGELFKSLSAVAKKITGSHWSGNK
ncbi:MAG: DUF2924 domain-containing protein, partial [Betaproteobacteria bacterium]|nr:DUF2924 domain-containing protein [Betaproteobacteria bacterium]